MRVDPDEDAEIELLEDLLAEEEEEEEEDPDKLPEPCEGKVYIDKHKAMWVERQKKAGQLPEDHKFFLPKKRR